MSTSLGLGVAQEKHDAADIHSQHRDAEQAGGSAGRSHAGRDAIRASASVRGSDSTEAECTTDRGSADDSAAARVLAEGHTIGNHSYSHPTMTRLSTSSQAAQMDTATRYISAAISGGYKPCFFRPPGGAYNATTVSLARNRGMSTVIWSLDTRDWTTPLHLSSSFQSTIVYNATHPASSHPDVLMHDGSPGNYRQNTVNSVQRIITYYKSRGYQFTNPSGR